MSLSWHSQKEYYKKYNPIYAVEYKVDDTKTQLKKAQVTGFVKQVKRFVDYLLADNADLDRAFALYHYRGKELNGEKRLMEEIKKLNLQKDLNLRLIWVHKKIQHDLILNIASEI